MLSPAEQDIIQRDQALPGLGTLLDSEAFVRDLRATANLHIRAARLHYLRYKPGQNCLAAYTVNLGDKTVECYAKAFRSDDRNKLEKKRGRRGADGPMEARQFIWNQQAVAVCIFPNDHKLRPLPLLDDPNQRRDFLERHLTDRPDLWNGTVRQLAYKPERRWTGALEVNGVPSATCKLYGESSYTGISAKTKHVRPGEVLERPAIIGRSKGRRALFFGWMTGSLLSEAMVQPEFELSSLTRVGVALRELHRQSIPTLPARSNAGVAAAILDLGGFVSCLLPTLASRIDSVARELASGIHAFPEGNTAIHGDFYARQILLNGERVAVLDFDEAARGHAGTDLGSFAAHLEREVIAGKMTTDRRDASCEQLLAGYRSAGGEPDESRLTFHTAERLFARLAEFFRRHDPNWPQLTRELLERIESLLATSGRSKPSAAPVVAQLPMLESALSRPVIAPHLFHLLRDGDSQIVRIELKDLQLRRHKRGRRALIEYGLEVHRARGLEPVTLLAKMRRRGVDADNLRCLRELHNSWANHPSREQDDLIAIPEVHGAIPEFGMTLQRRVPGVPLGELLSKHEGALAARRAADAICKLHRSNLNPERIHTVDDELKILTSRFAALASDRPKWRGRLSRLHRACREAAAILPVGAPSPIHRDFYHDQLLLDGSRVWLLDLDLLCLGDPWLDAGNFVGHLLEWSVRSPAERPALENAAAAFTERFVESVGRNRRDALEIYTTLTLARHVSISAQFPDRAFWTGEILELCEERCGLTATPDRRQLSNASQS